MTESFSIKGYSGDHLTITLVDIYGFPHETCHWGGYDTRAALEINSGSYNVKSSLVTSTGNIFSFFQQLKNCNDKVKGSATFISYEGNLTFTATYDERGHVKIHGDFSEDMISDNQLIFSFDSDQTFIKYSLDELAVLVQRYGDQNGLKGNPADT